MMSVSVAILGPFPSTSSPASVGGVAVHGDALSRALRARGHTVVTLSDSHMADDTYDGYGIRGAKAGTTARLGLSHLVTAVAIAFRTIGSSERRALGLPFSRSFTRALLLKLALADASPDIVHVQQADFRQVYLSLAGWAGPVALTVHGLGALATGEYPALRTIVPAHMAHADAVTAPSTALACEIETVVTDMQVDVVPNAVDHDLFAPPNPETDDGASAHLATDSSSQAPTLLYVGRITLFKGADDLLRAFETVRATLPHVTLTMVGPHSDEVAIDTAMSGLTLLESVPRDAVPAHLAAADLTIVPSHYEGFGLSALESLACGTPVVATDVGGLPEIIDEQVGALVPPSDPQALAKAIVEMLEDSDSLQRRGRAGMKRAARYTWDETAAGFERIYRSLL